MKNEKFQRAHNMKIKQNINHSVKKRCHSDVYKNAKHKTREDEKSIKKRYVKTRIFTPKKIRIERDEQAQRAIMVAAKFSIKTKGHRKQRKEGKRHSYSVNIVKCKKVLSFCS